MDRLRSKVLMSVFISAFLLSFLPQGFAGKKDANIIVATVKGDVSLIRKGREEPLEKGAVLKRKDVVRTGANASVDIIWKNKWGYRLLGNSECVLAKTRKIDSMIEMREGNILVNVKNLPEGTILQISTPTAIAGVRGTQFWGRVNPDPDNLMVTFAVRRGEVDITIKETQETLRVLRGQALEIPTKAEDIQIRPAKIVEMQAMAQIVTIPVDG